jgi:hypothetical protein
VLLLLLLLLAEQCLCCCWLLQCLPLLLLLLLLRTNPHLCPPAVLLLPVRMHELLLLLLLLLLPNTMLLLLPCKGDAAAAAAHHSASVPSSSVAQLPVRPSCNALMGTACKRRSSLQHTNSNTQHQSQQHNNTIAAGAPLLQRADGHCLQAPQQPANSPPRQKQQPLVSNNAVATSKQNS